MQICTCNISLFRLTSGCSWKCVEVFETENFSNRPGPEPPTIEIERNTLPFELPGPDISYLMFETLTLAVYIIVCIDAYIWCIYMYINISTNYSYHTYVFQPVVHGPDLTVRWPVSFINYSPAGNNYGIKMIQEIYSDDAIIMSKARSRHCIILIWLHQNVFVDLRDISWQLPKVWFTGFGTMAWLPGCQ